MALVLSLYWRMQTGNTIVMATVLTAPGLAYTVDTLPPAIHPPTLHAAQIQGLRRRAAARSRRRGAGSQARPDAVARARDLRAHPRRRRQPAGRSRHRAAVHQPDLRARGAVAAGALPLLPEQVRGARGAGRAA